MAQPTNAATTLTSTDSTGSTLGGFLRPEQAGYIFEDAAKQSVVQRLVPQIPLGANGVEIPYVTSKPTATWVGEAEKKKVTSGGIDLATMRSRKLAAIFVVSAEVVRANPGNYVTMLRSQMAEAFALAFDAAALHGTGSPFDTYIDQATKTQVIGDGAVATGGVYGELNGVLSQLVADGKKLRSWAFDERLEPTLNASFDTTGRPLFVLQDSANTNEVFRQGTALNRPAFIGEGVANADGTILGYGGDWSKARWGVVGGITYDVSQQASVTLNDTLVSLWEHNLVAVRAEAEYGFYVHDTEAFVKLTAPEETGA